MSSSEINNIQALDPGTIISSGTTTYTIKEILGSGAFGITYLATGQIKIGNIPLEVPFAIKEHFMQSCFRNKNGTTVLCTPGSKEDVELSRKDFLTEAKRLQQLCNKTKHIVKVNEAFESNGTAYYVMEYLSGGSMKACTKQQAVDYMLQIAEAVKVLHDNRVLHLDIKPSNVILKVDEDTSDTYPVLIDFGITKHFDDSGKPTTTPNSKGASPGYAPIEQYDDVTTFSPAIDIYAMGATLFYMLTGKNPPNASKLCYDNKVLRESLSQARCGEFIPFITKAMAPNYHDRFGDVNAFKEALQKVQLNSEDNLYNDSYEDSPSTVIGPQSNSWGGKDAFNNDLYGSHVQTESIISHVYKYGGSLKHINNAEIERVLQSIILAQDTLTGLYGIVDSNDNIILPFEYNSIGLFEEIPEGRGSNFTFGWRLLAPAQKVLMGNSYKFSIEILNNGRLMETYRADSPYTQPLYPNEIRTYGVVKKQTLNVGNVEKTIYIQQIPWGRFGLTDEKGNVVAPFIYDSIEPFSEYCSLPGPGLPQMFLGSRYRVGDDIGFFKITDDGIVIDYKRFSQETYQRLSILT